MKKIISLLKASLSEGMNLFKVNTKKSNPILKVLIPIFLAFTIMGLFFSYSMIFMKELRTIHMEYVLLTIFILFTSMLSLIEGIYKSGSLLFNCRDDNLLLSLPIQKRTVLFIRVFKFYLFELLYNSMFLLPSIVLYAYSVHPGVSYYVVSLVGLLVFPIVPILLSCLIGTFITFISSKFKGKNMVQTVLTIILLVGIMYFSYNSENIITSIAQKAVSYNDLITKIYYPAGAYIALVTHFNVLKLLEFIGVHIVLFLIAILLIGKLYFRVNSSTKSVITGKSHKNYSIHTSSIPVSFIKKEFNRFINSTVFVTNAGFGLVLFIIVCILACIKMDSILSMFLQKNTDISTDIIQNYLPLVLFGFICFSTFMSSITSSMISLEGKSFLILKSLPLSSYYVVQLKVLTASVIVIPCILIGSILVFIRFHFNFINIILLLIACILIPLLSETIGIVINLKYPKMDAQNDTEVVKQSMSTMIATFLGMGLSGLVIFFLYKCVVWNISIPMTLLLFVCIFTILYGILSYWLYKNCDQLFRNIMI